MQWKAAMRNNQHREDYFQSSLLPKEKDLLKTIQNVINALLKAIM